ncbi:acyl-CoA reductase [Muricauda sp. SCSIO 64092]|uniref:acyl-CoA reductase n=1 Tax=Allomuricauda sp. SCSIO 64092 TaxID=2908842 RepID=UPI001FF2B0CB|nr:acyl-CoA reductase [Muricauda sp. SCSIO 64092]
MAYPKHLQAFVKLGDLFAKFFESDTTNSDIWAKKLENCMSEATIQNAWFTKENLLYVLKSWGTLLNEKDLLDWQSQYPQTGGHTKTIAVVMAGNIPLVGFHDFLCVLLSGNRVLAKLSSNDTVLLPFIGEFLIANDVDLKDKIEFTEGKMIGFDAVIATGSNNTGRYFAYYFGQYPHIIRRNRNSVAVLTHDTTETQLQGLGNDVFRYFGLGCRSVSKLFVPKGFPLDALFNALFPWKTVLEHHKYVNNYDYNKAVYLMSDSKILDNGFLILKEDSNYGSPIATLFFEYYDDKENLAKRLEAEAEAIQCIVSKGFMDSEIPFGQTQSPKLSDYADGIDTMKFLCQLEDAPRELNP